MIIWLTMLAGGVITYLTRLSFLLLLGRMTIPEQLRRALRFVPVTVLTAIFLPEMLLKNGSLDVSFGNPRFLAGVVSIVVAWRTKNVLLTILAGMVALWLLQALMQSS